MSHLSPTAADRAFPVELAEMDRPEDGRVAAPAANPFTIGVEEEFHLVDPVTCTSAPDAALILSRGDWEGRVSPELQASMIETRTAVCDTLGELRAQLVCSRRELVAAAAEIGCGLVAAGTMPTCDWSEQRITSTPRFEQMLENYQLVAREQLICSCQTH